MNSLEFMPSLSRNFAGPPCEIQARIVRAMRDIFDCPTGNVEKAVLAWLDRKDVDVLEFVARFRSVLALAALRSKTVKPDLVILDEFHRYADLILPKPEQLDVRLKRERARVHRLLVDALLGGEDRPAVLLLSATPYRLRRLDGDEIYPVDHYRSLIDLVGFLADDQDYKAVVESAFRQYYDALRTAGTPDEIRESVYAAKLRLEGLLLPPRRPDRLRAARGTHRALWQSCCAPVPGTQSRRGGPVAG
jgi:hypothetical protein